MPARRILLTNCWLASRAGTELYVRDLALALQRAGRHPMVFSPILGDVAEELRQAGVPVTDDLAAPMATPDLIHGHHAYETVAALSRFPHTPGIYVEHDAAAWQDEPPHHPRLLRHLAVDELCRERVVAAGIPAAATAVIPNSVDLQRFARREPLPDKPRRGLVLTNSPQDTFVPAIRQACEEHGIELDVLGMASGRPVRAEDVLHEYDVVFAKARTALEALAVGCSVVVCDRLGVAGMVTSDDLVEWRRWNFGRRLLTRPHEVGVLGAELARYDPADAARCTDFVREHCGLDAMVGRLTAVYDAVVEEFAGRACDHAAELVTVAPRLARLGPLQLAQDRYDGLSAHAANLEAHATALEAQRETLEAERAAREAQCVALDAERAQWQSRVAELDAERPVLTARVEVLTVESAALKAQVTSLASEAEQQRASLAAREVEVAELLARHAALEGTLTFRLRDRVLRSGAGRVLVMVLRRGRRSGA